jgi:hypothetical protein
MAKAARSNDLKAAFEEHEAETEGHVARLEKVFEEIDERRWVLQPKARHWIANHLHSLPKQQLLGEFSDGDIRSSGMSWHELRAGLGLLLAIALIIGGSLGIGLPVAVVIVWLLS